MKLSKFVDISKNEYLAVFEFIAENILATQKVDTPSIN